MFYIKKATIKDVAEINRMACEVFPETYKDILSDEQMEFMMGCMYSTETLSKQIEEKGYIYFIAYFGKEPMGYVSIQPEGADLFHLHKIYVLPRYQKYNIGSKLFEKAVEVISEMHPQPCTMEMNINRSNASLAVQEHLAMKKPYLGDPHLANGVYMNDYIVAINV